MLVSKNDDLIHLSHGQFTPYSAILTDKTLSYKLICISVGYVC